MPSRPDAPKRPHRPTHSPRVPTRVPLPARAEREALDSLRQDFDEAGLHVGERREFTGFRVGPVLDLPIGEPPVGTLGWRRRIDWSPSSAGAEPDAWLYLTVGPRDAPTAWAEGPGNRVAVRLDCGTEPPSSLFAVARSEVGVSLLGRFAIGVCAELEADD